MHQCALRLCPTFSPDKAVGAECLEALCVFILHIAHIEMRYAVATLEKRQQSEMWNGDEMVVYGWGSLGSPSGTPSHAIMRAAA